MLTVLLVFAWLFPALLLAQQPARARALGIVPGTLPTGRDACGERIREAARCDPGADSTWTVGVLVQSNFGGLFTATTVSAKGGTVEAIPVAEVKRIVEGHGRLTR